VTEQEHLPGQAAQNDELAPSQRRLWLLSQLHPGSAAYNVAAALRLSGRLSVEALRQALDDVVARHEALRVGIAADDLERPWLRWHQSVRGHLLVRELAGPLTDETATTLAQQLAGQPIPLDKAPLLRAELCRAGGDDALLTLSLHHVISDQRSIHLVLHDLAASYAARLGERAALTDTPPALRDHIRAERELVGSPRWQSDLAHWRQLLADPPHNRPFPFQIGGDSPGSLRGAGHDLWLGQDLSSQADQYARGNAITPAMLFMTCIATVAASWLGEDRIVIGVPVSRRVHSHEQDLVGFLVETLPILVEPGLAADLGALLHQVRDRYLDAATHATPTFDAIVEALQLPSRPLASPLFRTWFNDLTQGGSPPAFPGLTACWVPTSGAAALFDANFYLHKDRQGYRLELVRAADRIPAAVADEMLAQCRLVLAQMLSGSPDRPDRLVLLTPVAERQWAEATALVQTSSAGPAHRVRGSLRTPHGDLTAPELDNAVNDLAGRLRAAGAEPGQVIQIEARRSGGLPLALLAAWRAGTVPALLDATLPTAWLAEARALVRPALVVSVHEAGTAATSISQGDPCPRRLPDASHLLFTTGSDGAPSAVVVPPEALAAATAWYETEFAPCPADRVALLAGVGHDPVLRDMLVPLRHGGTLIIPPAGLYADPAALLDLLADAGLTILHATPALLELLMAGHAETARQLDRLRLILSSGAPLHAGLVRRLRELTQAAIVNGYGTTETPQIAARHLVLDAGAAPDSLAGLPDAVVPLGHGVPSTGLLVVNRDGHAVGVGQLGEIVVRGANLAAGYLDERDPHGRFVQDLFTTSVGEEAGDLIGARGRARMFRTGDMGRLSPDGLVHFAGRRDRQVIINGFRVELAEVELAARRLPGVAQAAAGLVETVAGPILGLDVVPQQGAELPAQMLRGALRARLRPQAMPTAIAVVDRLDMNANHKVVLRADAPGQALSAASDADAEPKVPSPGPEDVAGWLASLLAQIVGREVGFEENFFEAGLTSISLLQLHTQVANVMPDAPPPTALFAYPNLAAFASYLAGRRPAMGRLRRQRDAIDLLRLRQDAQLRRDRRQHRVASKRPSTAE
jgi:non-ribosomal peptide synthetase component F